MRLAPVAPCTAGTAAALLLIAAAFVGPASGGPPAQTGSLPDLLDRWLDWAFTGDHPDHFKQVQFLPLPNAQPVDDGTGTAVDPVTVAGETSVTLKKNDAFVLPLGAWTKEAYLDGTTDPDLPDAAFLDSKLVLMIDGKTVIDTTDGDSLLPYYVLPTKLDSPIVYDEPTGYGSVATIGFQGIGIVIPPLSVGEHTMTLYSEVIAYVPIPANPDRTINTGTIYNNKWHITVRK